MLKIDLISASRERPERMRAVLEKWIESSDEPKNIRFIVSIDSDDPTKNEYEMNLSEVSNNKNCQIDFIVNPNKSTVHAINACKKHLTGDFIFVISDDTDCFKSWDTEIKKLVDPENDYFIIKTSDGIGSDLITMPIFSKGYLENKKYIYYPGYKHMFCDTELTCVASLENCIIDGTNLKFQHLHYTVGYHEKDHIDIKNQDTFYFGMKIFKTRMDEMFNMKKSDIKGKIPEPIYKWMEENTNK